MIKDKELIRLSTFNTRGLGENSKRRITLNWLRRYYTGILFLQETHSSETSEKMWRNEWKGQLEFSHGKSTARGVAILLSPAINITVNKVSRDSEGRFLLLETVFEGQALILINIYAPTEDNQTSQYEFLQFVHTQLREYTGSNIILGGDFNVCLEPCIDKKGGKN